MSDTGKSEVHIGYLVNQYPKVSHSFIRREIEALERMGVKITPYSLRRCLDPLVDVKDLAEAQRTQVILDASHSAFVTAFLCKAWRSPTRIVSALKDALRMGMRSKQGVTKHVIYVLEACYLARLARSDGIDHFHVHFGTNAAAVAMHVETLSQTPFSLTLHGPEEFDDPIGLQLEKKIERASFVVAISEFGRNEAMRWSRLNDRDKIKVVRCGLDFTDGMVSWSTAPDSPTLVCVGRLCVEKGQDLLIEAFAHIKKDHPDAILTLVGDGPLRTELETLIQRHDLERWVSITGWASGEQVLMALRDARAVVLPSFAEGLPVAIMEAFAVGRPVITTPIAGIPELVEYGQTGWMVPPGNRDALIDAMKRSLNTPIGDINTMGKAARDRVVAQHEIQNTARTLKALFMKDH